MSKFVFSKGSPARAGCLLAFGFPFPSALSVFPFLWVPVVCTFVAGRPISHFTLDANASHFTHHSLDVPATRL